jgi:hypothetical protein
MPIVKLDDLTSAITFQNTAIMAPAMHDITPKHPNVTVDR